MIKDTAISKLTARELEIFKMISTGCLNKQIAYKLDLSETTVKIHITKIMRKLGVINRTQVATYAVDQVASHKAEEEKFIFKIALRANARALTLNEDEALRCYNLISTVHNSVCPLRLNALLEANIDDFFHDVKGIMHYFDIVSMSFTNCWEPRFAL